MDKARTRRPDSALKKRDRKRKLDVSHFLGYFVPLIMLNRLICELEC